MIASLLMAGLGAGCTRGEQGICAPQAEVLPASLPSSLIAVVPRTSAGAAKWALRELMQLLPFAARAGLVLHVLYTQDGDDGGEGGGDGGPPQALLTASPSFAVFQAQGVQRAPADPNGLTAKLYCERLAAWQLRASLLLTNETARRAAMVRAWVSTTAARLSGLAAEPIPDTAGSEAGVEFDAGVSIFSAAQVAEAAPRSTILFLGGLTSLAPPSQKFTLPAHLVALVRSSSPTQVLQAENAWSRWVTQAGGTFEAMSANDTAAAIAGALVKLAELGQGGQPQRAGRPQLRRRHGRCQHRTRIPR